MVKHTYDTINHHGDPLPQRMRIRTEGTNLESVMSVLTEEAAPEKKESKGPKDLVRRGEY